MYLSRLSLTASFIRDMALWLLQDKQPLYFTLSNITRVSGVVTMWVRRGVSGERLS